MLLGVQDLHVGVGLDVAGRRPRSGPFASRRSVCGPSRVQLEPHLLEVEDDVGDVLVTPGDRRELVQHALDPDGGDRRPLEGGQQHPPQGVAEGHAEAALQRLGDELAVGAGRGSSVSISSRLGLISSFQLR